MCSCHKHNISVGNEKIEKSIFSMLKDLYSWHFKNKTFESNPTIFLNLELHLLLKHGAKCVIPLSYRIFPAIFLHIYSLELIEKRNGFSIQGAFSAKNKGISPSARSVSEGRSSSRRVRNTVLGKLSLSGSMPQIKVSTCLLDTGSGRWRAREGAHS